MKVGIIGYGYVGKGVHRLFKDKVKSIYDPYYCEDKEVSEKGYTPSLMIEMDTKNNTFGLN